MERFTRVNALSPGGRCVGRSWHGMVWPRQRQRQSQQQQQKDEDRQHNPTMLALHSFRTWIGSDGEKRVIGLFGWLVPQSMYVGSLGDVASRLSCFESSCVAAPCFVLCYSAFRRVVRRCACLLCQSMMQRLRPYGDRTCYACMQASKWHQLQLVD